MSVVYLADCTFEEIERLQKQRTVAIVPVGATEAHGPHLPLGTDVIIAEAMAESGARRLDGRGITSVISPPFAYSAAGYAAGFAGTISIRPETATQLLVDVGRGLAKAGLDVLAIANGHLDPDHIGSLKHAARQLEQDGIRVVYPDVTRKPWALKLTDEFKSGACHAGQYEGSMVLARRPDLVKEAIRETLDDNPASLSVAIREGKTTFEQAGGPRAYFGSPRSATSAEGHATIAVLGQILEEAILERTGW